MMHHACAKRPTQVIWPKFEAPVVAVFFMMIISATILLSPVLNLIVGVVSICRLSRTHVCDVALEFQTRF